MSYFIVFLLDVVFQVVIAPDVKTLILNSIGPIFEILNIHEGTDEQFVENCLN